MAAHWSYCLREPEIRSLEIGILENHCHETENHVHTCADGVHEIVSRQRSSENDSDVLSEVRKDASKLSTFTLTPGGRKEIFVYLPTVVIIF